LSSKSEDCSIREWRIVVLEKLFDEPVKKVMAEGLVIRHVSADGTLVRANASYKSFVPIEVAMDPDEYEKRPRAPLIPGASPMWILVPRRLFRCQLDRRRARRALVRRVRGLRHEPERGHARSRGGRRGRGDRPVDVDTTVAPADTDVFDPSEGMLGQSRQSRTARVHRVIRRRGQRDLSVIALLESVEPGHPRQGRGRPLRRLLRDSRAHHRRAGRRVSGSFRLDIDFFQGARPRSWT
jgi:hypothetical protein